MSQHMSNTTGETFTSLPSQWCSVEAVIHVAARDQVLSHPVMYCTIMHKPPPWELDTWYFHDGEKDSSIRLPDFNRRSFQKVARARPGSRKDRVSLYNWKDTTANSVACSHAVILDWCRDITVSASTNALRWPPYGSCSFMCQIMYLLDTFAFADSLEVASPSPSSFLFQPV